MDGSKPDKDNMATTECVLMSIRKGMKFALLMTASVIHTFTVSLIDWLGLGQTDAPLRVRYSVRDLEHSRQSSMDTDSDDEQLAQVSHRTDMQLRSRQYDFAETDLI